MTSAVSGDYQLVQLANGERTLFSASYGEKMHPGLGPRAEAELLYVRQLRICERLSAHTSEFVIWDIGLGAAANAIAVLQAAREISGHLRLISFDNTDEPLAFSLNNSTALSFPAGYEKPLAELLRHRRAEFTTGKLQVSWEFHLGDFSRMARADSGEGKGREPPALCRTAIFYDALFARQNPAMWTLPVFENLFLARPIRRGPAV